MTPFFSKVEEFVMLVDPKLSLFTGDETTYGSYEADRPQHRITQFRFKHYIHLFQNTFEKRKMDSMGY